MEKVCVAINNLTKAINKPINGVEIFAILAPIVLSIVAIWISLLTVKKQTKIELFDKRYDVYYRIKEIINFKNEIKSIDSIIDIQENLNKLNIVNMYLSVWQGTNSRFNNDISFGSSDRFEELRVINSKKSEDLRLLDKIVFLYSLEENEKKMIIEFYKSYEKFIVELELFFPSIENWDNLLALKNRFVNAVENIEKNLIEKMEDIINITNIV